MNEPKKPHMDELREHLMATLSALRDRDNPMDVGADLVDALNDPASGRHALCKLRVATDDAHPKVLAYFQARGEGWRDA